MPHDENPISYDDIVMRVDGIHKWFGHKKRRVRVLYDVKLRIPRGTIVSLVGPSGCGKSTAFKAICGIQPPDKGATFVTSRETHEEHIVLKPTRDIGIVFQDYSLFPFRTAVGNVVCGPKFDQTTLFWRLSNPDKWGILKGQIYDEAVALLEKYGLGDHLNTYPHKLSGG